MNVLINIDVPDLPRAIAFYQNALGLTLSRTLDDDVAELSGAGTAIFLLQKQEHSSASKSHPALRQYTRHWTPVHLDFVVDNLIVAAQKAEAAGALRESECIQWRCSKCITFSDPFGHGFCLIEFTHGTYED